MSDIKRNAERAVIAYLRTALPTVHFVPSKGDDEDNDPLARADGSLEPPFCVVECYEAERLLPGEPVNDAKLNISYVVHISESTSAAHSLIVEQITDALVALPRGWHETPGVTIHGHDIGTATSTEDEEKSTFADVIPLTLGITG